MWDWHNRLEQHICEGSCRAEIESIARHGQLLPVLGRPLRNDPAYDIELIYGARRMFVARHLNRSLLVELRELADHEALIAMDIENRQRADLCPYERGCSYARWLGAGHFRSQEELAAALQLSRAQLSRLLSLARLPSQIINAFERPADICEGWGADLLNALEGPRGRTVLQKAHTITAKRCRPPAREIYRQLVAAPLRGSKLRARGRDEVIKDSRGKPLFRVRLQTNSVAITLPAKGLCEATLSRITQSVEGILCSAARLDPRAPAG
jgi:ParB family chromosome partitioning protein